MPEQLRIEAAQVGDGEDYPAFGVQQTMDATQMAKRRREMLQYVPQRDYVKHAFHGIDRAERTDEDVEAIVLSGNGPHLGIDLHPLHGPSIRLHLSQELPRSTSYVEESSWLSESTHEPSQDAQGVTPSPARYHT
jgi:hypothetical protein